MGLLARVAAVLTAVALLLPLGSCGPAAPGPAPGTDPSGAGSPGANEPGAASPPTELMTLRRSGGFAGVAQTVVVSADGGWTFQDLRQGDVRRRGRLPVAERDHLRDLLASPALVKEAGVDRRPAKCADGLVYQLTTGTLRMTWSDCGDLGEPATAVAVVDLITLRVPLQRAVRRPAA